MCVKVIGIKRIPLIQEGDDLAEIIIHATTAEGLKICNGDILVIAETAVAKAEGCVLDLKLINPSKKALVIADKTGKDAKLVEAIISESTEIVKLGPDFIISETKHGFVCANAGIDESNVEQGFAKPIPTNPDISADKIRTKIEKNTGKEIAVIISDTQGRTFREGALGVAIGISGIEPLWNRQGETDLYGKKLQTTQIAVADELASTASIVMGQADEGIPVVIVRGIDYFKKLRNTRATLKPLIRPKKYDVFRQTTLKE
jgi:coenzyme F420-0:L-glutamate ligase/coenzyme F420-1:gamma-L-glutamate ligase